MTELATIQTDLAQQMEFARSVTIQPERGAQSLLPKEYQANPANVLIAVGLGSSMGLSPAESLYRITVIQGKPTASAELIAANVRKAGHKLRVKVQENPPSATCTIIRADDPDEPTTIVRDMEWAKGMGLVGKDNYKKQPSTMLAWRAITACARLACPEALYGVAYTSDEMWDEAPRTSAERPSSGLGAALATPQPAPEPERFDEETGEIHDAEIVEPTEGITQAQLKRLQIALRECGITDRDEALTYYQRVTMRAVDSSKSLSKAEAGQVLDDLERVKNGEPNLLDGAQ